MGNSQNIRFHVIDSAAEVPEIQIVTAKTRSEAISRSKKAGWKNPIILKEEPATFELDASAKVEAAEKKTTYYPKHYRV